MAPLCEPIALDRHSSRFYGGLGNPTGLAEAVRTLRAQVIVNAAAYTAVDKPESELELANAINAQAPEVLGREAAVLGAWLVHYSTDYVFGGGGDWPWRENDPTFPLNDYGQRSCSAST